MKKEKVEKEHLRFLIEATDYDFVVIEENIDEELLAKEQFEQIKLKNTQQQEFYEELLKEESSYLEKLEQYLNETK